MLTEENGGKQKAKPLPTLWQGRWDQRKEGHTDADAEAEVQP